MSERQVFRIINGEVKKVALDTVDRALVNEKSTWLWELDYEEEDFEKAAYESERTEQKRR